MVVNVKVDYESTKKYSNYELLAWLNGTLLSGFLKVEQTCSGAAYCQLMDLLSPGCINLKKVKFRPEDETEVLNNYMLLEDAFKKTSVSKPLQLEELVSGNITETYKLLLWFKLLFEHNFLGQPYDPVAARGGQYIEPFVPNKPRVSVKPDFSKFLGFFPNLLATLRFINQHWPSVSVSHISPITYSRARIVLGSKYPNDITAACSQDPYCLYLYHGLELAEGEKASTVLIGYFDEAAGERKVRLLDVFQPLEETDATLWTSLADMLKKFELPLVNLAVFYSISREPAHFISGLKVLNPGTVFLCGLSDIAKQACHSGIMAMQLSEEIQRLVKKVHKHFHYLPVSLRQQLSSMENPNFSSPLTSQCLLLRTVIHEMTVVWSDLEQYFRSQGSTGKTKQICCLLNNRPLRLSFLFMSHALQPLCEFQGTLDHDEDVTKVLQDATSLVQLYASSFLKPKAVESILSRKNCSLKKEMMEHLPRAEIKVGELVVKYLLEEDAVLTNQLDLFYKGAISFYMAVITSIVKCLPLPDSTLRNMAVILSPEGKMEVTGKSVADLGVQLGFCPSAEDVNMLTDEFLEYQLAERDSLVVGPASQSVERYWREELRIMGRTSIFRKLILSLLALPKTLSMERVFEQVSSCSNITLLYISGDKDDDVTDSSSYKSAPSHPLSPETQESVSSDIIDLTEVDDVKPMATNATEEKGEDQGLVTWLNSLNNSFLLICFCQRVLENRFAEGEMIWGHVEGFAMWPGLVQQWPEKKSWGSMREVVWFGDRMVSKVHTDGLCPFSAFAQCFCPNSFATGTMYKDAIFHSLQVAADRAGKVFFLESDSKEEMLRVMLDWAFGGFKPSGPSGLKPRSKEDECLKNFNWRSQKRMKEDKTIVHETQKSTESTENPFHLREVSVCLKKLSLESLDMKNGRLDLKNEEVSEMLSYPKCKQSTLQTGRKWSLPDNRTAPRKQKNVCRNKDQNEEQSPVVEKEQNYSRRAYAVPVMLNALQNFCLSCGTAHVEIFHPLFEGSLCMKCKDNFTETLYRYDEDGYQSYCTVCCAGLEVMLCGNDSCCRSYCMDCLEILVGKGTYNQLKRVDPWICYLCALESSSGVLKPRQDWSIRVQEFFANNSAMEFEPHRVYPAIPANLRRPIRVLSLFDGIGTGYLVLKDLGFKVEKYVASEIDEESIVVSLVNHDGKITYVDDVRRITKKHITEWGPFDLLIGGSPCNDLSIVNPARKGLFEGTGRLFFDFYRLLNAMKPKEDDPRPFFWLFENVVFMNTKDKANICRFLECNPVLVDAVKVSPAHRARYFWGNLPGMNRPIIASQNDKLTLQECLENGRKAKFVKVRTITTRTNSLKQGTNDSHFPVSMNGKDDSLWITELEKIFGFPKHYTDVKNMSRMQRQKVLGKSWSVPVIRHLFAPLKDYFACDEVPLK
uniref:DNA (cytosine-5-)-methyltransferase n=1 Tax=Electrophorus electricus TaxID=8005 RepID=A0A4W4ESB0_ELEEL